MIVAVIDPIDREILSLLVRDGRAAFKELGQATGLSPHAAADRVRRLRRDGVITGFTVTLDPGGLGRGLDALVDIRLLPNTDPTAFERVAGRLASVREVAFVTGRSDYHLRVSCGDANDLDQTIRALRRAGAAVTETRMVMRSTTFPPGP